MNSNLNQISQWLLDQRETHVMRLRQWCDQNSWSLDQPNLKAMADRLVADFAAIGVEFEKVSLPAMHLLGDTEEGVHQPTGPALLWHHRGEASRRVLLMIHYDTVYPPDSTPATCQQRGSQLIGPGTADAKGGIQVIAMAIEAVLKYGVAPDLGISVLLNPDEEVGSPASASLMEQLAPQFDAALVFEPTLPDGALVRSRKGSGNFALIAHGRAAHAGRNPEQGRNAIVHLTRLIPELTELHAPEEGLLLNVGRVAGGGPLNQVPDHAVVHVNLRVADEETMHRAEASLADLVTRYTYGDYRMTLRGRFHAPPKPADEGFRNVSEVVSEAAEAVGRQVHWKSTGGASDGSKLAAFGLPNVDTMGVSGGNLHHRDEFCELDSVHPAAMTVVSFLERFAAHTEALGRA